MIRKQRDRTSLICDIGELSGLFTDLTSLDAFLNKVVEMVAHHMHSEVCSIYLYFDQKRELVLSATKGLNKDYVGNVRMKLGEGLTGVSLKNLVPVCERHASKNPNFKYFSGLGEENFESYLAVPIVRGSNRIGVLVVQNKEKDYFDDVDTKALRAITSQIANTVEFTRFITTLDDRQTVEMPKEEFENITVVKGIVASEGFAYSKVYVYSDNFFLHKEYLMNHKKYSLDDFKKAVELTAKQLEFLQGRIEEKLSDVASLIFSAQILMLKDSKFIGEIEGLIQSGINPPEAVEQVGVSFINKFKNIPNAYLQERSQDVKDVVQNLLIHLTDSKKASLSCENCIVIANELFPSDALKLSSQNVKGIVLLSGGSTSHFSLLAQSLQIPVVIAENQNLLNVSEDSKILLDAQEGYVYVNPSSDIVGRYRDKEDAKIKSARLKKNVQEDTYTADGTEIILMANVNLLGDLTVAKDYKAKGVGLYRSEFPFIIRNDFPSEEEQRVVYQKIVDQMPDSEITFRTLDIGGDKMLSYFPYHRKEKNPSLGMRSIRFSLGHIEIFSQQIRAILQVGAKSKIRIMFPMVSSLDEFRKAKEIVLSCIDQTKSVKASILKKIQIGAMVELPSLLEVIDELAHEADFLSIGTNDFIQYMLAVDRTNEKVADFYIPYHPSVLRGIKKIVDAGKRQKKDVSICGDMAHESQYLPFFLGIGISKISLNPNYIPQVQSFISTINMKDAKRFSDILLGQTSIAEIKETIERFAKDFN